MKIALNTNSLCPQDADHKQFKEYRNAFMQQIERVINSVFCPSNALFTTLSTGPTLAQNLAHLQDMLFDRLYPSRRAARASKTTSKIEIPQQPENSGNSTDQTLLAYLMQQKSKLEKTRSALDQDFWKNQSVLNQAEDSLPQYRGIIGRIKEFFFFWCTWRDDAVRRDFQANRKAAKEWYVVQCKVLDQAREGLDQKITTLLFPAAGSQRVGVVEAGNADHVIEHGENSSDISALKQVAVESIHRAAEQADATAVILRQRPLFQEAEQKFTYSAAERSKFSNANQRDCGFFADGKFEEGDNETSHTPAGTLSRHDSGVYEHEEDTDLQWDDLQNDESFNMSLLQKKYVQALQNYLENHSSVSLEEAVIEDEAGWQDLRNDKDFDTELELIVEDIALFGSDEHAEFKDSGLPPLTEKQRNSLEAIPKENEMLKEYYQLVWVPDAELLKDNEALKRAVKRVPG